MISEQSRPSLWGTHGAQRPQIRPHSRPPSPGVARPGSNTWGKSRSGNAALQGLAATLSTSLTRCAAEALSCLATIQAISVVIRIARASAGPPARWNLWQVSGVIGRERQAVSRGRRASCGIGRPNIGRDGRIGAAPHELSEVAGQAMLQSRRFDREREERPAS